MRFCARHRLILPRRSSTAGSSHESVHRRSSHRLWGRVDLQSVADFPVHFYLHAARQTNPELRSARSWRDEALSQQIHRVWEENFQTYGVRKVGWQLRREGLTVARCTVECLMRQMELKGVIRGKTVKAMISDADAACPLDRVNRQFSAERPNALWGADFTYVRTWRGFVYVAFVIDVFARTIVGWKVSTYAQTDFVLDAL